MVAATMIKKIENELALIKTGLDMKTKENLQLVEMNYKLHNSHSEYQKLNGRTHQKKKEYSNDLYNKNKQLTQIV